MIERGVVALISVLEVGKMNKVYIALAVLLPASSRIQEVENFSLKYLYSIEFVRNRFLRKCQTLSSPLPRPCRSSHQGPKFLNERLQSSEFTQILTECYSAEQALFLRLWTEQPPCPQGAHIAWPEAGDKQMNIHVR